jgi:hypothetical protein
MKPGYWKQWYEKNKRKFITLVNKHKRARRKKFHDIISLYKDRPCVVCGKIYPPVAMDFYHRDKSEKKFRISNAQRLIYNFQRLIDEINKCDVYCAVCRRIVDMEERADGKTERKTKQNKRISYIKDMLNNVKNVPCADCGCIYPPYAMELDHINGDKIAAVSEMIRQGKSLEDINKEIGKTEVVCLICHRIRTENRKNGLDK